MAEDAIFMLHLVPTQTIKTDSSLQSFWWRILIFNYRFIHKTCNSEDLTTFVQLEDKSTVLHVTNLKKRLVISLPENLHDLRTTRFFLLVKSSSKSSSFGFLHFRQDQLHIDLFVFFSVFFSCFFLFLAVCILVWRFKSGFDRRRAQQRHQVELLTMAQRPFASHTVQFSTGKWSENSGLSQRRRPLGLQPLVATNQVSVATILVQMPYNQTLSFGCVLSTLQENDNVTTTWKFTQYCNTQMYFKYLFLLINIHYFVWILRESVARVNLDILWQKSANNWLLSPLQKLLVPHSVWKLLKNVALEFFNFGISTKFLTYPFWHFWLTFVHSKCKLRFCDFQTPWCHPAEDIKRDWPITIKPWRELFSFAGRIQREKKVIIECICCIYGTTPRKITIWKGVEKRDN